ncbi:MAG: PAS domain-containing sensor histidine kinase [Thermodesulfobacteriota bacterium]
MSKKQENGSEEMTTEALGQIVSFLKKAGPNDANLGESLRVISEYLSASGSALLRLKHDAETEAWQTEGIGSWPPADMHALSLDSMSVPDSVWQALKKREIIPFCLSREKNHGSQASFLFLPIFLEDRLSCLIVLRGLGENSLTQEARQFLECVINLFELWLSKVNINKRLDDLINFLPYAVIGVDTQGNVTVWNSAVEQMTGWKGSRVLGKDNYEYAPAFYGIRRPAMCDLILHPDPRWLATYTEYREEGDVVHSSIFTPALGGTGAFVTSITGRMRDINGRVYGSLHMVRDVTRERQIESKLQSSESMFKTITDYAGLGIALFQKGTALYYNDRFESLLGISGREICLNDLIEAVDITDRTEIRSRLDSLFQGTEKGPLRLDLNVKVGNRHRYYSSYSQILDYEGNPTICFVLDDTTEQKELARKVRLNEVKMYHEGRLTSLGIMAAGIAHELNQPLNTIRVVTDGFLFGRDEGWSLDSDELYEGMEMISSQVQRMSEVIRNIRNFSREDREEEYADVDVNRTIEDVFSMIGRQFEAHGIVVHKKLADGLSPVRAHSNRLEQVIMNLLVNARQALDECNREYKELWITTKQTEQSVCIETIDNATGIPSDLIDKIFDPFFTTKEVGQGTGLGLTISKSIIRDINGTIEVSNNDHGGATFLITLPCLGERK